MRWYVYRLVDPRDGATFYIGKGKNRRAWVHVEKLSHNEGVNGRVAEIRAAGAQPAVVIDQSFSTEAEAVEHEANLICATGGLLNIRSRGWALTPEGARLRDLAAKDREFLRLGRKHREDFRRRIAYFDKFETYGLPGLSDTDATKIVKAAVEATRAMVADWDARLGAEVNAS